MNLTKKLIKHNNPNNKQKKSSEKQMKSMNIICEAVYKLLLEVNTR